MSDGFDYNYLFAADADFDQPLAASYLHHNLLLSQPFFPTVADHYNDPAHPPLEEAVTPRLLCNEMPCKTEGMLSRAPCFVGSTD